MEQNYVTVTLLHSPTVQFPCAWSTSILTPRCVHRLVLPKLDFRVASVTYTIVNRSAFSGTVKDSSQHSSKHVLANGSVQRTGTV